MSLSIAVQVQDIRLQAGSGSGSGSSGKTGNGGNGNGNGASVGRGSTRGRRDRADEWVRRTRPDEVESKVSFLTVFREVVKKQA